MKRYFIIHHLGLGDHIVCNGLVRELLKECDILFFPVKHHNVDNIRYMLKDVSEKIQYIPISNDSEMLQQYQHYQNKIDKTIRLGNFIGKNWLKKREHFCEAFYRHAGVAYDKRWESFYIEYDKNSFVDHNNKMYNFLHEDKSRNYLIDDKYKLHPYYEPDHVLGQSSSATIFDYYNIINQSNIIHCMDSSFCLWVDHVDALKNKEKYIHRYAKERKLHNGGLWPKYKNNWSIIK
jgi:hypothetical protein